MTRAGRGKTTITTLLVGRSSARYSIPGERFSIHDEPAYLRRYDRAHAAGCDASAVTAGRGRVPAGGRARRPIEPWSAPFALINAGISAVSMWLFPAAAPPLQLPLGLANGAGFAGAVTVANLLIVERRPRREWNQRLGWLETVLSFGQGGALVLAAWPRGPGTTAAPRRRQATRRIQPAIPAMQSWPFTASAPSATWANGDRPARHACTTRTPGRWPA
jgi:hypothetical protein